MKSDISGFPEFLPNEQIVFNSVVDVIRECFEFYGFAPMDTPAVERIDTLLAKGDDNEIYGLYRLADSKYKKDLGLRFDLTVPLARYVASKFGKLMFPYKRYQIASVWRGERPQYGRYRQFYQCDIDVVGDGKLSIAHDAEIIKVITEIFDSLKLPAFCTKLGNRKVLSGFLKELASKGKIQNIIKIIDKIDKVSVDEFWELIAKNGVNKSECDKLKSFLEVEQDKKDNFEILAFLKKMNFNPEFNSGVLELEETVTLLRKLGIEDKKVKISTKLARGLAYYTGNVFETRLNDFAEIGSIAGGGRYDNLVSVMSDKKVPGVGASIGITRLMINLIEKGYIKCEKHSPAQLLVTVQNRSFIGNYMQLSARFRKLGVKTETYLQDKPLGAQLTYASKKGIKKVLIANDVELLENKAILRDLVTKRQTVIATKYMGKDVLNLLK